MCHDEVMFASPHEFNPERFLVPQAGSGESDLNAFDPTKFVFGFGRR